MTTITVTTTGAGSFTIPAGVTSIEYEGWGPGADGSTAGGSSQEASGGGGGYIKATISVTAGDIIYYNVGVSGTSNSWFNKNTNSESPNSWAANRAVGTSAGTAGANGSPAGTLVVARVGGNGASAQGGGGSRGGSGGGGAAGPIGTGSAGAAGSGSSGGAGGNGNGGNTTGNGTSNAEGGSGGDGGAGGGGAGTNGGAPGGGGGGGGSSSGVSGTGARGQIRYTYTATVPTLLFDPPKVYLPHLTR